MTPQFPTATCRIQLRCGFDFAALEARLDQVARLGVSHLYLSPIFQAMEGSTHGYDITDPTRIDPALGGREGFERLARSAARKGLGIILDIVPNHTAFSAQNAWLADVLRHGPDSDHARHFDIDWHAGPLVLPFLAEPFAKMLADGAFAVRDGHWRVGELALPLAPGTEDDTDDLAALHEAQHWRLVHAEMERDGITHRRFFNVTGLIGMRVEDQQVFDDTHALIFDLVEAGLVQGLRVDHIDGLADPAGYLRLLAARLPDTPVWVEKIVVGDEALPDEWKTVGTTGYETARLIARILTPAAGIDRLDTLWRTATDTTETFHEALIRAKLDVLDHELAAERRQLGRMAARAVDGSEQAEPGPESLREAVTALLVAIPRYRTYVVEGHASAEDRDLIARIATEAASGLRSDAVVHALAQIWADPESPAQRDFVTRLQQVSGALLAKAQEDTAGFRWTRYLAANEVGAEPAEPTVSGPDATAILSRARASDMVLTSTHDTKRSEDSRMRMVAISHLPEAFEALLQAAQSLPQAAGAPPGWQWYVLQSALALHGAEDAAARLAVHMEKAMREAKLTSFWTSPDTASEQAAAEFGAAVLSSWGATPPAALKALLARGDALILTQLLFKMIMPGFPDIYRGTDVVFLALTDPDNRRPVDWDALAQRQQHPEQGCEKSRWTHWLLAMRTDRAEFLAKAGSEVRIDAQSVTLIRKLGQQSLVARLDLPGSSEAQEAGILLEWTAPDGSRVSLGEA